MPYNRQNTMEIASKNFTDILSTVANYAHLYYTCIFAPWFSTISTMPGSIVRPHVLKQTENAPLSLSLAYSLKGAPVHLAHCEGPEIPSLRSRRLTVSR